MKRRMAAGAAALALVTGGGVLAGCGSSDSSSASSTSTAASDTTAQAPNGVEKLSAQEIASKSKAAAASASSVTVSGTLDMNGDAVGLDLSMGEKAASGSVTLNGMEVQLRAVDGKVYLKFDPADLAKVVSDDPSSAAADQIRSVIGDKWLVVPTDSGGGDLAQVATFGSKDGFLEDIFKDANKATVAGTGDVNGTPVVLLEGSTDSGTLAVQTVGEPYPVQIKGNKGGSSGSVDFSKWNAPVDVTAPTDVLDLSALSGASN